MLAKMEKISIISLKDFKEKILDFLSDKGFVEMISLEEKNNQENSEIIEKNTDYKLAKTKRALEILTPYFIQKKSLLENLLPEKRQININEIKELKNNFNYLKISEKTEKLGQDLNILKSEQDKLDEERNILLPWLNLNFKTNELETKTTKIILGVIKKEDYKKFKKNISEKFPKAEVGWVNRDDNIINAIIIFSREYEKNLLSLTASYNFKLIELSALDVLPKERFSQINGEIESIKNKIQDLKAQAQESAQKYLLNLQAISDILTWQTNQEQIQKEFLFTKETFSILGWIKKSELSNLKQELKKITNSAEAFVLKQKEGEQIPIVMENSRFLKPFEFVTNIYSFPQYGEIDPTPYLAGFFIIFFGMCLTDAGYGLALALGSFLALKFLKFDAGFKKLLRLLFYGGIITFVAGALTGGWFGIVLENLPSFLSIPLIKLRQINPVNDPITMLVISLILGYIHLLFASVVDLVWKIKHNEIKKGLIDSGVWIYFLLVVGLWLIAYLDIIFAGLANIFVYLIYSSLILIILTQGKGKSMIAKVLGGLGELYFGVTGYISDILSYSRLLALGLATGIIGMVINIVGSMANEMIPYVGWIFMILILIVGHLMNLTISLVGAFVHAGRLQYVEFFKRFFEGGGKEFKPFKKSSQYINLVREST